MATNDTAAVSNLTGWKQDGSNLYMIRFSDDPTPQDGVDDTNTVWLYSAKDKTYRPFVSPSAIYNFFGGKQVPIATLPTSALNDPSWDGSFLPRIQGVQDDGSLPQTPAAEPTATAVGVYGAQRVPEYETSIANGIALTMTKAKNLGYITQATFDKYVGADSKSDFLAKGASAYLYGGYAMEDILRDIKARELADKGDPRYAGMKGFDSNIKANDFYKTPEGQKSSADGGLVVPAALVNELGSELLSLPLFQIPSEAFKTLVEPVDWTSPEFQEEADAIKAAWFDATMQIADAQTEQAKAVANENYRLVKSNIEKKYGMKLSDNAIAAWDQLEQMFTGYSEAGMLHSGFMNKTMDKYMKAVRKRDEQVREAKLDEQEMELREHLLRHGSPEEISQFVAENGVEKARTWGLIPDQATLDYFSMDNLRKEFPDMSEEELTMYRDILMDSNGHFTSELYQNLYKNQFETLQSKKDYQQLKLFYQKLDEEKKAYKQFEEAKSLAGDLAKGEAGAGSPGAPGSSAYTPKAGYAAIPGPITKDALQKGYEDWYTSPDGKTLYGKTRTGEAKTGYEPIPGPINRADLESTYKDWYTSADGKTLYGTKKDPSQMGISSEFKLPEGYQKIEGRPGMTSEEINKMYEDAKPDPTNTFLYGKPKAQTNLTPSPNYIPINQLPSGIQEAAKNLGRNISNPTSPTPTPSNSDYWNVNPNKNTAPTPQATGSWTKGTITYNPSLHGTIDEEDLKNQGFIYK